MTAPVSLIVISYESTDLTRNVLETLAGHGDRRFVREVVIVDNGFPQGGDSRTGIRPATFPFPIHFVQNAERSYASGINRGAQASRGDYLAIANNDVSWLGHECLGPLLDYLERTPRAGVAGPQLVFPDGSWQRSYGPVPSLAQGVLALFMVESVRNVVEARRFHTGAPDPAPRAVGYVDGAFMVVRRRCFRAVDGFDERFAFYGEDVDFCWRARRRGWGSAFVPTGRLMHVRGATSSATAPVTFSKRQFQARYALVACHRGPRHARWYARLERLEAWERAILYRAISRLRPTPAWRRRAEVALSAAKAASAVRSRLGDDPV